MNQINELYDEPMNRRKFDAKKHDNFTKQINLHLKYLIVERLLINYKFTETVTSKRYFNLDHFLQLRITQTKFPTRTIALMIDSVSHSEYVLLRHPQM